MTETGEKPLHVRVAEALGWTEFSQSWEGATWKWCGRWPEEWVQQLVQTSAAQLAWVPLFDTDWSATGPLIERFEISLEKTPLGWRANARPDWHPQSYIEAVDCAYDNARTGQTPLEAVCNLILALSAAGKLPKQ